MSRVVKFFEQKLRQVEEKIPNNKSRQWEHWKKDSTTDFQFTHFDNGREIQELRGLGKELVEALELLVEAREMKESQEDARAIARTLQIISSNMGTK